MSAGARLPVPDRPALPLAARALLVLAAFAAYAAAFPALYRAMGPPAGAFSVMPALVAGALLGQKAGALAGVALMPVQVLLFSAAASEVFLPGHLGAAFADGVVGAIVGRLRDLHAILEGKQGELEAALRSATETARALRSNEFMLSLAQEVSHTGSYVLGLGDGRVSWSAELFRLFGREPQEEAPCEVAQHVHKGDLGAVQRAIASAIEGRSGFELEHRIVRTGGEVRWVHAVGRVLSESGRLAQLVVTLGDVTERKRLQGQVVASQRLASLGVLAAGVSHEINNPLAYVVSNLLYAEEATERGALTSERAELRSALGDALQGTRRIASIVKALGTLARGDGLEPACRIDVRGELLGAVQLVRDQLTQRARLECDLPATLPAAWARIDELGRAFQSLLVNAAQAIPEGNAVAHRITVRARADDGGIVVSVADTGDGIAPDSLERIFEPFFTTRPVGAGTGLGLTVARSIVEGAGGRIEVESVPGRGSTFRVHLPAAAPEGPAGS